MENKNLIIAIFLSTLILLGWSLYFENPEDVNKKNPCHRPARAHNPHRRRIWSHTCNS